MASIIIPGRSIPKRPTFELPRLNRDSPQAEGLRNWWPLVLATQGHMAVRDFAGNAPNGIFSTTDTPTSNSGMRWAVGDEGVEILSNGTNALNILIGNIGTLSYPITYVFYGNFDNTGVFDGLICNRDTETLSAITGNSNNQLVNLDFDAQGFDVTGPTIPTNEFVVCVVSFHSGGTNRWVASSQGLEAAHHTKTHTKTSGAISQLRLFFDDAINSRVFDGSAYDCRIYDRQFTDADVRSLYAPATRWDLYEQRPRRIYVDLGAAATQKVYLNLRRIPKRPTYGLPRLNRDSPQARGLKLWYTFNPFGPFEVVNNRIIPSSDFVDSPSYSIEELPGFDFTGGLAPNRDGVNVTNDHQFLHSIDRYTVHILARFTSTPDDLDALYGTEQSTETPFEFRYDTTTSSPELIFWNSSGLQTLTTGVNPGTDYFWLTMTRDVQELALYQGGLLRNSASGIGTDIPSSTNNYYFGLWQDGNSRSCPCHIVEARVYNRALTDTEVFSLFDPATRWDLYEQEDRKIFVDLAAGRIMSSLVNHGGLAGKGGIAGPGGGLAG